MVIYYTIKGVDYQQIVEGETEIDRIKNAIELLNKLKSRADVELLGAC